MYFNKNILSSRKKVTKITSYQPTLISLGTLISDPKPNVFLPGSPYIVVGFSEKGQIHCSEYCPKITQIFVIL